MKKHAQILFVVFLLSSCQEEEIDPNQSTTNGQTFYCNTSFGGLYECERQVFEQHMGVTVQDTTYIDTLEVVHVNEEITAHYWTFHQDSVCQEQNYIESGYQFNKSVRFWGDSIHLYSWGAGLGGQGSSNFKGKKL